MSISKSPSSGSWTLALGAAAGAIEAAVRASPQRGWDGGQSAAFIGAAVGLAVAWAGLAWCAARLRPAHARAVVGAAVVGLGAAVTWRYELVLNELVRDPKVFLGVPAAGLVGAAVGAAVAPRLGRGLLVGVAVLATAVAGVRARPVTGAPSDRPNVLVISLDTTRADAVAGKPAWERLAREGTVFSQAIAAAPITEPSHLAMFTGQAPWRSGIVSNGTRLGDRPLVWERFADAGWLTAGFVAGFPLHGKYGWGQGMAVWDDDFGAFAGLQSLSLVKAYNQVALKEHALRERSAARVLARAERWLTAHRDETFFAFVHFYDAHGPYEAPTTASLGPPPVDGTPLDLPPYWPPAARRVTDPAWLVRAYDEEVRTVDAAVARLVAALGDRLDHTVVVVTADHGESLTEHDYLFDHGDDLYDPSLRVPLVIRHPGRVRAGQVVPCQVGGVDLAPTLLALAGLAPAPDTVLDGISRTPELAGEPCRNTAVVASTTAGRFVADPPVDHALRGDGQKIILKQAGPAQLYDLRADPGELHDLAPSPAADAHAAALRRLLEGRATTAGPDLDDQTRRALEALGYIEEESP